MLQSIWKGRALRGDLDDSRRNALRGHAVEVVRQFSTILKSLEFRPCAWHTVLLVAGIGVVFDGMVSFISTIGFALQSSPTRR